jgi:hypothetical protein
MNRYKLSIILASIGIILVSSLMILTTYAYFTVDLNEEETSDINLITFNENTNVIFNDTSNVSLVNAYTGEEVTKVFSIDNLSNYPIYYDIVFNNVVNNFSDRNYLVYDLSSTNNGAKRIENAMPREESYIAKNVLIDAHTKQEYTMTIRFLKKNEDQNIDQNKTFSSNIKIVPSEGLNIGEKIFKDNTLLSYVINDEGINYTNSSTFGNTIYYYSGSNPNNNVIFNNYCFKIIRTDDDNNIKMIYNGVYENNKCSTDKFISSFIYNSKSVNNAYVGYMYGKASSNSYESEHENINSSAIKIEIDNWFNDNFKDVHNYISNNTIYCNDRSMNKFVMKGVLYDKNGYAKTNTGYYDINKKNFDYICSNINDRFSVNGNNTNKSLNTSVGLITYNEFMLSKDDKGSTFLNSKNKYWTMTPAYFNGSDAYNYVVNNNELTASKVNEEFGVRPVITIVKDTKIISGDGSNINPYIIEGGI